MSRADRTRLAWRRLRESVRLSLAAEREDPADPVIWPDRYDVWLCQVPGHGYHRADYHCPSGGALDAGSG